MREIFFLRKTRRNHLDYQEVKEEFFFIIYLFIFFEVDLMELPNPPKKKGKKILS